MVEWFILLPRIPEVQGSNLGQESVILTGFLSFSSVLPSE
jgi:hypothetical protein